MMVAQQQNTVPPGSPHGNGLSQSTPSPFNLDHYKYLTSLLPATPHPVIETVSFTDFNTWDCQIRVNLTTESDCIKWLAEFEDKTRTDWRANHEATKALTKAKGCSWQLVYKCVSPEAKKDCSAGIQFRIFADESRAGKGSGKGEPCEVKISFCHSHETQPSLLTASESYKSQDIPSHLKEGFEGYFQETMSPVQPGLTTAPSSHSSSMAKCSPAPSTSPQPVQLQLKLDQPTTLETSRLLENGVNTLRTMIQQGGTGEAAVVQFLEKLERLGQDRSQLEDALTRFGTDQWDWFMPDSTVGAVLNSATGEAQTQVLLQPQSPLTNPGRINKKHKGEEEEVVSVITEGLPQVFGTNLVNGQPLQVLLQPTSETPEPDMKRRKRARCGACTGCKNRDKTQDCRQCRNCLDQKRYGGPGRLKKACIKRLCVVISQMISHEVTPEEKQVLHSVPVTPVKPSVKTEPQETSVTLAARAEASQPVNLAAGQTVSLVGAGGQTVSLLSSPGGHGGQTIQLNGQTYTIGTQPISLSTAPGATSSSQASVGTSGASTGGLTAGSTLLSWPSSQFPSTFQVQPQQPVQFVFQPAAGFPSATAQPVQVQYTTQLGSQQLEGLVSEASRQNNGVN